MPHAPHYIVVSWVMVDVADDPHSVWIVGSISTVQCRAAKGWTDPQGFVEC